MKNDTWMSGFISGLVCGEGNFTIAIVKKPASKLGYHVRAAFQIELHIHDAQLLEEVQRYFGFGGLNYPKPRTRFQSEAPTCRYFVTAIPELLKLTAFFRKNPLIGAKQQSFEVWAQCLEIVASHRHTSKAGFDEIVNLRQNINHIRRPATYRAKEDISSGAAGECRKISSWTTEDEAHIQRYLAGQISRSELDKILNRTEASISNKITRMRRQ